MTSVIATSSNISNSVLITRLHEVLASLNAGFISAIIIFGFARGAFAGRLYRLDDSMSAVFQVKKADLATNYFAYFTLALILALCAWLLLRLTSASRLTRDVILLPLAGLVALAALPAMTINPWSNVEPYWKIGHALEILVVLLLGFHYMRGKLPGSIWILTLIFHFVFWSRELGLSGIVKAIFLTPQQFRAYMLFVPAGAPIAWTIACLSAFAWAWYVHSRTIASTLAAR